MKRFYFSLILLLSIPAHYSVVAQDEANSGTFASFSKKPMSPTAKLEAQFAQELEKTAKTAEDAANSFLEKAKTTTAEEQEAYKEGLASVLTMIDMALAMKENEVEQNEEAIAAFIEKTATAALAISMAPAVEKFIDAAMSNEAKQAFQEKTEDDEATKVLRKSYGDRAMQAIKKHVIRLLNALEKTSIAAKKIGKQVVQQELLRIEEAYEKLQKNTPEAITELRKDLAQDKENRNVNREALEATLLLLDPVVMKKLDKSDEGQEIKQQIENRMNASDVMVKFLNAVAPMKDGNYDFFNPNESDSAELARTRKNYDVLAEAYITTELEKVLNDIQA